MSIRRKAISVLVVTGGCIVLAGVLMRNYGVTDLRYFVSDNGGDVRENSQHAVNSVEQLKENKPVQRFVMTKVEKTGSSTLRAILGRFIINNRLNVLTSCKGYHIIWTIKESWTIGPGKAEKADALVNHALYNKSFLQKFMKPGYKHIALVREPISWFKSAVRFFTKADPGDIRNRFHFTNPGPLKPEEVAANDSLLFVTRKHPGLPDAWFHLGQLLWYGFNYADRNNITAINSFIASLVKQADVIMLYDQLDASLVLLKRKFHWTFLDIFYKSYAFEPKSKEELSKKSIERILSKEVNFGDKLLYDSMNRTWWNYPELKEQHFWEEVNYFKELNKEVNAYCSRKHELDEGVFVIPASEWHEALLVTPQLCSYLRLPGSTKNMINQINDYAEKKCTI
ncbi:galactose-3-O-sulfotransferase 2-like [Watersipora subatra]|uniref:galactose-3-O-sulfotransferase 2-like n=1 Tax=Watersipora subatra TaxID=2589382 RepID=UPI00355C3B1E